MSRALIVTRLDASAPRPEQMARLHQIVGLYLELGFRCDVLALGPATSAREAGVNWPVSLDSFSRIDAPTGVEATQIRAVLAALPPARLVHFDRVLPEWPEESEAFHVYDAHTETPGEAPASRINLVLAAIETVRAAPVFWTHQAIRLPLPVTLGDRRGGLGAMTGWPASPDDAAAPAWEAVLRVLASRGDRVAGGLLLGEAPAGGPDIPPLLRRVHAKPDGYSRKARHRALGLAVLPDAEDMHALYDITRLLALRCPILTTFAIAERFEDRWHLPVCSSPEEFADRIEGWTSGHESSALLEAADATHRAFAADEQAMRHHLRGVLADAMLAGA